MDYPIQLPGKPPITLKGWGNLPIELLAAIAGVKPVTHAWIQEADRGYLGELRAGLGLKSFVYTEQSGRLGVMIGSREELLKEAARAWEAPRSNPGPNLGYPDCCSSAYCAWLDLAAEGRKDYIHSVAAKTGSLRALPFLLNDVFYLYSRPPAEGQPEAREEIERKNRDLPMSVLNAIPWHPCSYRCAPSHARAKKIWKLMRHVVPKLADIVARTLARPVLFWDWDRFAVLEATLAADGSCAYSGVLPPFSRLDEDTLSLLREGDSLRPRKGALEVRRGSKSLNKLEGSPILLDFVA